MLSEDAVSLLCCPPFPCSDDSDFALPHDTTPESSVPSRSHPVYSNADAGTVGVTSGGSSSLRWWTEGLQGTGIRHVDMRRTCGHASHVEMRHGESGRTFSSYRIHGFQVEGTSWGIKTASSSQIHGLPATGTSWGIKEANSVKEVDGIWTEGPGVSDKTYLSPQHIKMMTLYHPMIVRYGRKFWGSPLSNHKLVYTRCTS